ncbi:DUF5343 domain-containing protein, partial [Pontibacter rugosus]
WWSLRKKLHQTLPREISVNYLETALGLGPSAAKKYLSPIKKLGLIGDDGKPTDRAVKWRGDQKDYEAACNEMLDEIYPDELNDAIHDPREQKENIIKWFMNKLRIGNAAATNLASFYILIREADLSSEPESNGSISTKTDNKSKPKQKATPSNTKKDAISTIVSQPTTQEVQAKQNSRFQRLFKFHLDNFLSMMCIMVICIMVSADLVLRS